MVHCNPSGTPVDTESKLGPDGVPVQDPTLYRSLTGGLQYLTFTRLDLSYAVQQVCLYMHDLREPHVAALKRILRYVQGTVDFGLQLYASATTSLVGYTDADWAGCPTTRMSTLGYCVFLGDNLLSWSAKCQHTLSRFSVEVEYRGVANVVAETTWLRNLLHELHSPLSTATLVYCDNVNAVYMSANHVQHQRKKHIKIDIHFVCDMVTAGQSAKTNMNVEDVFFSIGRDIKQRLSETDSKAEPHTIKINQPDQGARGSQGAQKSAWSDPFILLEAIASNDLWIWHAFFGVAEMNNDVNVLSQSPLFNDLKAGKASDVQFVANNVAYKRGYYLTDEIYPQWFVLIKSIKNSVENDHTRILYKTKHEAARKDVERAFGVLKKKWKLIKHPARGMTRRRLSDVIYTCIILHNMIIHDNELAISPKFFREEQHRDDDP
ncbi:ribonuclease H-like domain-containing protein, partial [Tanacetum coccineum]